MRLKFFRVIAFFSIWLVLTAAGPANQTLIRGDYDGDGYQDLAVALVRPLGGTVFRTEFLARGSAGKFVFETIPLAADAFANGKYFAGLPTALATVLATSPNDPLLWTFITPTTKQAVQLRFGLPGDTVANAVNFDGDELDDIYVVRPGPIGEFGDGNRYLHWYVALTRAGGRVSDIVWGIQGDRVFTFYKDGKANLGALRIENSGPCAGQFGWYYMEFNADPAKRKTGLSCWGLPGDLPITPSYIDGKLKLIVSRPSGVVQVAYIRDFDGSASTSSIIGLADSIPGVAELSKAGSNFFWSQRSTVGYGESSFVGIRGTNGGNLVIPFGVTSNIIIRPDGTVVMPTDTGRFLERETKGNTEIKVDTTPPKTEEPNDNSNGSNASPCARILKSGYLWKPSSQDSGGTREGFPMILLSRYGASSNCFRVLASNFEPISCLGAFNTNRIYEGYGCGLSGGQPCGGRTSAGGLASLAQSVGGSRGGYVFDTSNKNCYEVSNFGSRNDRR